jgi:hypothetical protein
MSHFSPLSKEEKKLRDSLVSARLKQDLESFFGKETDTIYLDMLCSRLQPFLKSENKIENAVAMDYWNKLQTLIYIIDQVIYGK